MGFRVIKAQRVLRPSECRVQPERLGCKDQRGLLERLVFRASKDWLERLV
jgi:hypothetical protein